MYVTFFTPWGGKTVVIWKLAFRPLFPTFLGSCKAIARCPHTGPSLTCFQTCSSCAMLDPSWANWPSSAQVTLKLGPSGLLFGPAQGRPSLTPIGFWLGQIGPPAFLSVGIPGPSGAQAKSSIRTSMTWFEANQTLRKLPPDEPSLKTNGLSWAYVRLKVKLQTKQTK
jgi:hypothetical protein